MMAAWINIGESYELVSEYQREIKLKKNVEIKR